MYYCYVIINYGPRFVILQVMEEEAAVGQTLPELTTELVSAYTTQSSEIQLKEEFLQKLDSELVELQVQLHSVTRDVSTTVRTICLREDLLAKLGHECEELGAQVLVLVQEREGLKVNLQQVKKERAAEEKMRSTYESKMQWYEDKTKELGKLSATQVELEALQGKILALKTKSEE